MPITPWSRGTQWTFLRNYPKRSQTIFKMFKYLFCTGQPYFFIKCPYLRVWYQWHDLKFSHVLLLPANLSCNMFYCMGASRGQKKYLVNSCYYKKISSYYEKFSFLRELSYHYNQNYASALGGGRYIFSYLWY